MIYPTPEAFHYDALIARLQDSPLQHWAEPLQLQLQQRLADHNNGNLPRFLSALHALPEFREARVRVRDERVIAGPDGLPTPEREAVEASLRKLIPWRKGPFELAGVRIDSEWQCQMKWRRLAPHLSDLSGRHILDVGSGNGYFGWRMRDAGAGLVVGIDPSWLSVVQHLAVLRLGGWPEDHHVLPLALEQIEPDLEAFDTVFSMGVFYHRRSPLDHLEELRQALRPGGELVLETLVVAGGDGRVLVPPGRYARMNNVWFLPGSDTLAAWCEKMGFVDVRVVDETPTTPEEQRATDWKPGTSLSDYLDPDRPAERTIEGHPAPVRATLIARRPLGGRLRRYHLD